MRDYDAPFRMPDSYYDPPEYAEVCPKCASTECDDALVRTLTDTLKQFGVEPKAIQTILDDVSSEIFLGECYAAVTQANTGKLCQDHLWEDCE